MLAEGLVVETSAGFVVKELSEQEIMELYEIRVPLETLAARLAAEHLTPLHLAHIEALNEKFAAVAMLDLHVPTTDGRELVLTRYTEPEPELALLLGKLRLELPAQPAPKMTTETSRPTTPPV